MAVQLSDLSRRLGGRLHGLLDPALLPIAERRFRNSYRHYWETGKTPPNAERLLHQAVWASGGTLPLKLAREWGPRPTGLNDDALRATHLPELDVDAAVNSLDQLGYYIMPTALDSTLVCALRKHLDDGPCDPRGRKGADLRSAPPNDQAPTWWMPQDGILRNEVAASLACDSQLISLAGKYLRVDPLLMSTAMWKSYPGFQTDPYSAQMFHFDNDRAAFVKMFVYLTDVDEGSGPHVYIAGTHRSRPKALLHGRRIADVEVARLFPESAWVKIVGAAGTVFFADTAGFHKGLAPVERPRAVFQVNLASDRYGAHYQDSRIEGPTPQTLTRMMEVNPRFLSQFGSSFEGA